MSALNFEFLVQPTRMEGKNSYCFVKCVITCVINEQCNRCVFPLLSLLSVVELLRDNRKKLSSYPKTKKLEKFSREVGAWSWKIFSFPATIFYHLDCKTVRIFAYSSTREQSNKRSGTKLKTESETGERR